MEPLPKLRAAARGPSERRCAKIARRDSRALTASHRVGPAPGRLQRRVGRGRASGAAQTRAAGVRRVVFDADGRVSAACVLRELPAPGKRSRADDKAAPPSAKRSARRRPRPSSRRRRSASSSRAIPARPADPRRRRGGSLLRVTPLIGGRGCRPRTPRCATWRRAAASS